MAELNEVYRNRQRKRGVDERQGETIVARSHSGSGVEFSAPVPIPQPPQAGPGEVVTRVPTQNERASSQSAGRLVSASVCTQTVSAAPMASASRRRSPGQAWPPLCKRLASSELRSHHSLSAFPSRSQ